MSINKGKTKNKIAVRCCGEHGYGCKRKCSFTRDGYKDGRPFELSTTLKKKKKKHESILRSEQ